MSNRLLPLVALLLSSSALAGEYRIVGGDQAAQGAWPDTAGICWNSSCNTSGVQCTGTLIAPDVVVTAGHCVYGDPPSHVLLDSNDYRADQGEIVRVANAYVHSTYASSGGRNGYDIAVLKLEVPAQTRPRALAYGCVQDSYLVDGAPAVITGFGAHDQYGRQYDSKLREAFISINDADCSDMGTNSRPTGCISSISPGGEIGAGGDGVDTCFGDSGGPLYLQTEYGDYLVGATSRGYRWVSVPCRDGGIYVRPDAVIDWIEQVTDITIPETTCNVPPEPEVDGVLRAPWGKARTIRIDANDADQGAGHTYQVVRQPAHGEGSVSGNGTVTFKPFDEGYLGADEMVVEVVDTEGYPNHARTVVVPLEVVEGGCGCVTAPAPASAVGGLGGLIGLLALRRRRR